MNRRRLLKFFGFAAVASVVPAADHATGTSSRCLTYAQCHARLLRTATGWLGWTEQQAQKATIPAIKDAISMKCAAINPAESILTQTQLRFIA